MVKDYKRKIGLLIDMSVPTDNSISVNEGHKINKCKDVKIEIEKIWQIKNYHLASNSRNPGYNQEKDR